MFSGRKSYREAESIFFFNSFSRFGMVDWNAIEKVFNLKFNTRMGPPVIYSLLAKKYFIA